MLLEEDEDSDDGDLPINHVQSRKKKATKKDDEVVEGDRDQST